MSNNSSNSSVGIGDNSSKPEIELALGVRSDERIVIISNRGSSWSYPDSWERPLSFEDLRETIDSTTIVIIDQVGYHWLEVDVTRRTLVMIGELRPRLLAIVLSNEEHAKSVRRLLTSLYPWAEFWNIGSDLGKLIVTKDVLGQPYDRDKVIDMRYVWGAA